MSAGRDDPERLRESSAGLAGLSLAALALCCGLPVVLAAGSGVALLGVGLGSWVLIVAGLVAAMAGWLRWRRARECGVARREMDRSR